MTNEDGGKEHDIGGREMDSLSSMNSFIAFPPPLSRDSRSTLQLSNKTTLFDVANHALDFVSITFLYHGIQCIVGSKTKSVLA